MAISLPVVTVIKTATPTVVENEEQRVLLLAQKTSAGNAVSGVLIENMPTDGSENALFGSNSTIAAMVRDFKITNKVSRLDVIPLDDNGGAVAATGTLAITGGATADGTLTLIVGSEENHKLTIAVANGDTPTTVGDAIEAAVNADTNAPVTAVNVTGTETFTAVNGGTVGNSITLVLRNPVAGLAFVLTGMASGATDPVLTGVFDVVGSTRYQAVVTPSEYGQTFLTDFLDPRFNVANDIQDGVGFQCIADTIANAKVLGDTLNSPSLSVGVNELVTPPNNTLHKGGALIELNAVISTAFVAIRALRFTPGANISQFVLAPSGSTDNFGSISTATLPYFNTPMPRLFPPLPINATTQQEQEDLNASGLWTLDSNRTRTAVLTGSVLTTRKTDAAGNPEVTFKFLNGVDTSSQVAEFFFNNLKSQYAQFRITDGDIFSDSNITNVDAIKSFVVGMYNTLAGQLLTVAGDEAQTFFQENLVVVLTDSAAGKVNISAQVPLVTQLRELVVSLSFSFDAS